MTWVNGMKRGILAEIHVTMTRADGGSFNGRTADSDSAYPGSNPGPPAIFYYPPFADILAQESRKVTVRLNTGPLSEETMESTQK
jgi:hypothetical protein